MTVFHSDEPLKAFERSQPSIFLAGPTPRSKDVQSWRPEALQILRDLGYNGQVLVPERRDGAKPDYIDQVEWEDEGLRSVIAIVFWVPRKMGTMPALTTNVEFGLYVKQHRTFYGRPDDAESCRYLDWLYTKYNSKLIHNTLRGLLEFVVEKTPVLMDIENL
jgi:hypothetical protein